MKNAVATFKKGNKVLEIFQDENPESPRSWDNMGTMVCFHERYSLGDVHGLKTDMFSGWEEMKQFIVCICMTIQVLPFAPILLVVVGIQVKLVLSMQHGKQYVKVTV